MNQQQNLEYINKMWDDSIIPALQKYIQIPNKSPHFDHDWKKNGYMDQAVELIANWCHDNAIPGMKLDVVQLENRTPVIFMELPGDSDETILLYGHLDKQPEMAGWDPDLHPWKPVLRGDKLYGRGAADDGYAAFASLTAIKSLHEQNIKRARCVILIEACEESGSYDLPFYIDALKERIGSPSLVICLDSGCGNYDQLWMTTSLRGLAGGVLTIEVLKQGIHSGSGSGIAPSCFRILRQLLNRIENELTGDIILTDLHTNIPEQRIQQAKQAASVLDKSVYDDLPFVDYVQPESTSISELILRRTWKPALSVIGIDGMPSIENAGNVTLPKLSVKLSMRLPPSCDAEAANKKLHDTLVSNPPHDAKITFTSGDTGSGWNAPELEMWLSESASKASQRYFGKDAVYMGEGGSIPFMGMLGKKFPKAQFVITGVLGPASNAHGPNEFLHIPMGKKLTACVAEIIADHFNR
ncbi:MAG TPA: M20 family metallopeptidase [Gammaproteobacteria bacterium]|jgi:acetylornithine deacetylase/succinyl-diaminopimelate desuccinylase-like protein|nr:M20 family metallopeptidase [Gammaproteobacteria bacterium]